MVKYILYSGAPKDIKLWNISYTKPNAEDDEMDNHGVIHSSFLIFFKRKCTVF